MRYIIFTTAIIAMLYMLYKYLDRSYFGHKLDRLLGIPAHFRPVYITALGHDRSRDNLKKILYVVVLPANIKENELKANMKFVLRKAFVTEMAQAVSVKAYLVGNEDLVGECTLAPYGDFNSTEARVPLKDYKIVIKTYDPATAGHTTLHQED